MFQMSKLNQNMVWLIHKYDKLNSNVNRNRRSLDKTHSHFIKRVESLDQTLCNLLKTYIKRNIIKSGTYSNSKISPLWSQSVDHQNNATKINPNTRLDNMTLLITPKNNSVVNFTKIPYPPRNLSTLQNYKIPNLETIENKRPEFNLTEFLNSEDVRRILRRTRMIM